MINRTHRVEASMQKILFIVKDKLTGLFRTCQCLLSSSGSIGFAQRERNLISLTARFILHYTHTRVYIHDLGMRLCIL